MRTLSVIEFPSTTRGHDKKSVIEFPSTTRGHDKKSVIEFPSTTRGHDKKSVIEFPSTTRGHDKKSIIEFPSTTRGHDKKSVTEFPSTTRGHLRTNHKFKILLHLFLWPSIMFTEPTTKSSKQCCQTCPPQTIIGPRYSPSGKNKTKTKLYWLPVEARIHYKIATLAFRHFENSLPPHLSEVLHTYQPSRTLRSSSEKLLKVPKTNLKFAGNRSIHFQAAKIWNSLPTNVRSSPSLSSLKKNLKTHIFKERFSLGL